MEAKTDGGTYTGYPHLEGGLLSQYSAQAPDTVRWILNHGFDAVRWGTKHLPNQKKLPSGQLASRIALESVTSALDDMSHAAITSIWLPTEPFLALGVKPVCAEALAGFVAAANSEAGFAAEAENAGLPATYCSYHRVLMGMATTGVLTKPRMLASCSVACDANNLTFKTLAKRWEIPHFFVDVPYEADEDSISYVADQLRDLTDLICETLGLTLDMAELSHCVAQSNRSLDNFVRSLPLRRKRYLANDMGQAMQEALAAHLWLGTADTQELSCMQLVDYAQAKEYEGLNLIWAHTPPFFLNSLKEELNQSQTAQIIASDMLFDQVLPQGRRYEADKPFESMAERLCSCCFNGPATRRAERLTWLAEQTQADGAVIFCHWGCKETAGGASLMAEALEKAGYPTLILDGDGCDHANCMEGQMSTRMTAFWKCSNPGEKNPRQRPAAIPTAQMPRRCVTVCAQSEPLDLYGDIVGHALEVSPALARVAIRTGFDFTAWKSAHLPDKTRPLWAQLNAKTFFSHLTQGLDHPDNAVATSIFLPTEIFQALKVLPLCAEAVAGTCAGRAC
ncbi:MAG: 2-hydroxyacyl-CoA dehydratase subunit D [Atopobiaceae bacterium]